MQTKPNLNKTTNIVLKNKTEKAGIMQSIPLHITKMKKKVELSLSRRHIYIFAKMADKWRTLRHKSFVNSITYVVFNVCNIT